MRVMLGIGSCSRRKNKKNLNAIPSISGMQCEGWHASFGTMKSGSSPTSPNIEHTRVESRKLVKNRVTTQFAVVAIPH